MANDRLQGACYTLYFVAFLGLGICFGFDSAGNTRTSLTRSSLVMICTWLGGYLLFKLLLWLE